MISEIVFEKSTILMKIPVTSNIRASKHLQRFWSSEQGLFGFQHVT